MTDTPADRLHNQPPEPIAPPTVQERLAESHKDLVTRVAYLNGELDKAPDEVLTEEQFKPLSDLLKAGRVYLQQNEAARKIENEESRRMTAMIDSWFKNPAEEVKKRFVALKEKTDAYIAAKEAEEKKRRQAEADRKAAVAEEKRWDSIWADARAELAAYDARKAEERAVIERARKEAELRRADHLRNHAKRLGKVEPYLQARAERKRKAEQELAAKIADEEARKAAQKEADERHQAELARIEDEKAKAKIAADEAKKSAEQARRSERTATQAADRHAEKAEEHADAAEDLGEEAGRLEKRAGKAERLANQEGGDLFRSRSELGTTSSSTKLWKVISVDKSVIDLNLLRGFLHPDAVDVAVRGYMMAHRNDEGGPKLEGAVFEQEKEGVYR